MYSAAATASFGSKPFLFASLEVFTCDRNIHQRDVSSRNGGLGCFEGNHLNENWYLCPCRLLLGQSLVQLPCQLFCSQIKDISWIPIRSPLLMWSSPQLSTFRLSPNPWPGQTIESVIYLDDSHCVGASCSCNIHMSLLLISKYRFCCFPATRI